MALWGQLIMKRFAAILLCLAMLPTAMADDGLPILQRSLLPDEQLWQLETELTGHRERNGAVHECTAAALSDLLQQAGLTATVEDLVQVLTSPSESGTPESAIKELLLPRADCIQVSMDATFALITTRVRGGKVLDIFRNSPYGLTVHRLVR